MGYEPEPQLSLFLLPSLPPKPPVLLTPPLQTMASVPFQWEEAPGKPRSSTSPPSSKPKAARSLELPPRLLNEAKITSTPSPKTALDWPVPVRRSLSHRLSFSLGRSSLRIPTDDDNGARRQIGKVKRIFNSSRWASFKEQEHDGGDAEANFDFSSSIGRSSSARYVNNITGTRRRRSFFFSSRSSSNNMIKSHFWASIYESVKQAAPWRRKEEMLSNRMDVP